MGGRGASSKASSGGGDAAQNAGADAGAPSGTPQNPASNGFTGTIDGTDLTTGDTLPSTVSDSTPEAIMDAMDAQGFRGKPRVVTDQDEFDEAVKAAWDGNGLEVVRGIGAPDDTTLAAYRDSLTDDDWYVSCSGGAVHGYGMYGAYRRGGKVQQEDLAEAKEYASAHGSKTHVYHYTLDPSAKIGDELKLSIDMATHNANAIKNSGALDEIRQKMSKRKRITQGEQDALNNLERGSVYERMSWESNYKSYNKVINMAFSIARKKGATTFSDVGVFAASKGYDFYFDEATGYSVTLNRTKLIVFKDW